MTPETTPKRERRQAARTLTRAAQDAMGDLLAGVPWDWFTTHTFKADWVSPRYADRQWYSWFDAVRATPGPGLPYYFRVTELQDRGTLHYHALVGGVGNLNRMLFKRLWEPDGFARVLPYDPALGANHYVGKYIAKGQGDIRFSRQLDKRLRRRYITPVTVVP